MFAPPLSEREVVGELRKDSQHMHTDMATSVTFVIARYGSKKTDGRHPYLNGKKCVLSKHNCMLNTSRLMRLAALCCSGHPSGHRLSWWKELQRRK